MRRDPESAGADPGGPAGSRVDIVAVPASGLFAAVFESAPSGIALGDREGRIALVNREIERLFG